jgi:hypothetical protein
MIGPTEEQNNTINSLLHAIQTGVAYEHGLGSKDQEPKHLRVGINSALVSVAAVTKLLVDRQIIVEKDYWTYYIDQLEDELARYQSRAPANVTFH